MTGNSETLEGNSGMVKNTSTNAFESES